MQFSNLYNVSNGINGNRLAKKTGAFVVTEIRIWFVQGWSSISTMIYERTPQHECAACITASWHHAISPRSIASDSHTWAKQTRDILHL